MKKYIKILTTKDVDQQLSETSEFPVQNKVITEELSNKADLVDGKVPSTQLPSYVDDVVEYNTYNSLPATGEAGKIYVILDTNKIYRWSGSAYIEIVDVPDLTNYYNKQEVDELIAGGGGGDSGYITANHVFDFIYLKDKSDGATYMLSIVNGGLVAEKLITEEDLVDFAYTTNDDGTYTITDWNGTYQGETSTKVIIPDSSLIKY